MIEAAEIVTTGALDAQIAYAVQDAEATVTGAQDGMIAPN